MSASETRHNWFAALRSGHSVRLNLLCFPYAGGGTAVYRNWPAALPAEIGVYAAQLPGRGRRYKEPPVLQFQTLVQATVAGIEPFLDRPYALFGHSLGALLAFELTRELARRNSPEPAILFLSACPAPQLPRTLPSVADLPRRSFLNILKRFNGMPREVLANEEVLELVLPTVRADFRVYESYQYQPAGLLFCPVIIFGGTEDPLADHKQLLAWQKHTIGQFNIHLLPGDHFFLHSAEAQLLQAIAEHLQSLIRSPHV